MIFPRSTLLIRPFILSQFKLLRHLWANTAELGFRCIKSSKPMETHQISKLLIQTLSPDSSILSSATDALDHLSRTFLNFPFSLLSIIASGTLNQSYCPKILW